MSASSKGIDAWQDQAPEGLVSYRKCKGKTLKGVCLVEQCRRLARSSTKKRSHVVVEIVLRSEAACRGVCLAE